MPSSPDQIGSVAGQELTVSDVLSGLMTTQDQVAKLLLNFYQENPEIVDAMSESFKVLGVAGGAVLTALEEYSQGLPLSTVVPDSIIDSGLTYLTAESAAFLIGAAVSGPLAPVAIVGAAVVGGLFGHFAAQTINGALSDVENGPGGAAMTAALQSGQNFTIPSSNPDIPTIVITPGWDIEVPQLGVTFSADGSITTPEGSFSSMGNSADGFSTTFTPSGSNSALSFGANFSTDAEGNLNLGVTYSDTYGNSFTTAPIDVSPGVGGLTPPVVASDTGNVETYVINNPDGSSSVANFDASASALNTGGVITNWSGPNGTGSLTGELIEATTSAGIPADQVQIALGVGGGTTSTITVGDSSGNPLQSFAVSGTPSVSVEDSSGTLAATGSNGVLIDPGYGGTLMDYAPSNTFIDLSNGGSVATGANSQAWIFGNNVSVTNTGTGCTDGINCDGVTVNSNSGTIDLGNGDGVTLNGSNDSVSLGGSDSFTIGSGTGDTLNDAADDNTITLDDNTAATFTGTGDTIDTSGTGITVAASNETVNEAAGGSLNISGGDDAISLSGTGDYLGLLGGSGYTVTGSDATIQTLADTSLSLSNGINDAIGMSGASDSLVLQGGSSDLVNMTGGTIDASDAANLNVGGGGDAISLSGTGDYLGLLGGSGYTVTGSDATIQTLADTSLTLSGSLNTAVIDSGSTLALTGESSDTAWSMGDSSTITATGSGDVMILQGSADVASLSASDTVSANGADETVFANGPGDTVALNGSLDIAALSSSDTGFVNGMGGTIYAFGTNDVMELTGTAGLASLSASDTAYDDGTADTIFATGSDDTISMSGVSDVASLASGDTATDWANSGSIAATGSSDDTIALVGSGDVASYTGDSGNITLYGTNDLATTDGNSNVTTFAGTGDSLWMTGSGTVNSDNVDDGVNLYGSVTATINGSGGWIDLTADGETVNVSNENIAVNAGDQNDNISGYGDSVSTLDGTSVNLSGSDNMVTMTGNGSALGMYGSADTAYATGIGDGIWVGGNGQYASNTNDDIVTLTQGGLVYESDDSRVDVSGSGVTVSGGNNDTLGLYGSGDSVYSTGTGDSIWAGDNGQYASNANDDYVTLTQGGSVFENDNSRVDVTGSGVTATEGSNDTLGLYGSADSVYATGTDDSIWVGDNGQYASNANDDYVTLTQGGSVFENDNSSIDVSGNGVTVTACNNDLVGIVGSGDWVSASNDTIYLSSNSNATVYGTGNTLQGGADSTVIDDTGSTSFVEQFDPGNGEATMTTYYSSTDGGGQATGFVYVDPSGNTETGQYNPDPGVSLAIVDTNPDGTPDWALANYANGTSELTEWSGSYYQNYYYGSSFYPNPDGAGGAWVVNGSTLQETSDSSGDLDIIGSLAGFLITFSWAFDIAAGPQGTIGTAVDVASQYASAVGDTVAAAAIDESWFAAFASANQSNGPTQSPFEGAKWTDTTVTWSFAASPGGDPASAFSGYISAEYQAAIQKAMNTWAEASGLTLEEVSDSSASDIRIGWGTFDTADSGVLGLTGFNAVGGVLQPGVTVRLEDPTEDALVTGADGQLAYAGTDASLYQVALHEIGHALGLGDSPDQASIMYYAASSSDSTLDQTDISNIQALYNPGFSPADALLAHAMATFEPAPSSTALPPPQYQPNTPNLAAAH